MLFRIHTVILYFLLLLSVHSTLRGENDGLEDEFFKTLFLPNKHPVKQKLDKIFSESRASLNLANLTKAGFEKNKPRKVTKIIVTSHSLMPGFLFKLYLDTQCEIPECSELEFFIRRIEGANIIRKIITEHRLDSYFCVPKKWIYKIPCQNLPPLDCIQRKYLLVVEDMDIYSKNENKIMWQSKRVTHALLDNLYLILWKSSLSDGAKISNIPFTSEGRIAFIDTQNYGYPVVNYNRLTPYISKKNQLYWESITQIPD
ncbi:MAG: hypothetical protein H0X29_03080 [Parachlamydiaceae bacterium]|nr:hypothetical protein [Parachlamydiaceae bacterium]